MRLAGKLGTDVPVVLGPFGGLSSVELTAAVNSPAAASVNRSNNMSTTPAWIAFTPGETRDVTGRALLENTLYTVNYPGGCVSSMHGVLSNGTLLVL